ncbi:DUF2768 domain-containing protein [Paenibacillus sp. PR3]|uniref:DUF2768 domain-containing protein n=1 Tax=Paenibacillus terricola TaxID=2763503 RepID=A0ABR8MS85_9BACL|nr:DUF2768 family protein [Paenibacillus terricola]MBD3918783.1 DUF2768 domain-containing protein [Paenibacillus terricola]
MDPMTKMWISFLGIGLMAFAAFLISFARYKTKGAVRAVLSLIAFVMLIFGFIYGAFTVFT